MNWQPIETAPKGKSVLLYAGELCPLYCGKKRFGNLGEPQQDVNAWRCDSSGRFATPTHWMPLPAAPGEKCRTCSGHGAVGNILTAEPCPDCAPAESQAAPVAGQSRFAGETTWGSCSVEHVDMVLAAPRLWDGYEVRYLYAMPQPPAGHLAEVPRLIEFLQAQQSRLGSHRGSAGVDKSEWDAYEEVWTLLQALPSPTAPSAKESP